jgi:hypothetical protein
MVETQIALGDETPARRTAQRLMDAGLDRHEAIHAIGWVLIEFMSDLMETPEFGTDRTHHISRPHERLRRLAAITVAASAILMHGGDHVRHPMRRRWSSPRNRFH